MDYVAHGDVTVTEVRCVRWCKLSENSFIKRLLLSQLMKKDVSAFSQVSYDWLKRRWFSDVCGLSETFNWLTKNTEVR